MTQIRRNTMYKGAKEDRGVLANVVEFIKSYGTFFVVVTVVFSVVAVLLTLLISEQYTKQLNLSVTPVQSAMLKKLQIQPMVVDQAGNLAAGFLPDGSFGKVDVNAVYSNLTQQVAVTLSSEDRPSLEGIGPKITDRVENRFRTIYEGSLRAGIDAELANQNAQLESEQEALAQVERQSEQNSSEDAVEAARQQALENARVETALNSASYKREIASLESARKELPRLASEPTMVTIVSETEVTQSRPLAFRIVFSLISAFALAMLVTILRAALSRNG